jgi:CheY-like chemotaxis protein
MFAPFFTTRLAGTGLGLATVREIVRDHDGAISAKSKPGQGSCFVVWLPAATSTDATAVDPVSLPLGHGETVLIVEDERERLLRDEEKLAVLGYEPVGFEHASDALAACRTDPSRFDIILISQLSQTREGLDFARILHQLAPQKPVLLAIASNLDLSVSRLAEAGISEVLQLAAGDDRSRGRASALRAKGRHVPIVTRFRIVEILL